MARKAKKSTEIVNEQVATPAAETTPAIAQKLIVAARKFDRWYVYFKGIPPKDNVGYVHTKEMASNTVSGI